MTGDVNTSTADAPIIGHVNVWYSSHKMQVTIMLYMSNRKVEVPTLIDSGAAGIFIDEAFITELKFPTKKLSNDIMVYNVDGTINVNGSIMKKVCADLELKGKRTNEEFLVTALGRQRIILEYPWLEKTNPKISWRKKEFAWWEEGPTRINIYTIIRQIMEEDVYKTTEDLVISYLNPQIQEIDDTWVKEQYSPSLDIASTLIESPSQPLSDQWIQDKMTKLQLLTYQENKGKERPVKEIVPKEFHEFISTVFSERPIGTLPTQKPYDHTINLK